MVKFQEFSVILLRLAAFVNTLEVHTTKVFFMAIEPFSFNWNNSKDSFYENQVSYRASLLDYPDLPNWMHYTYIEEHNTGLLYGVPPPHQKDFEVEIIGLNKKKYEVRRRVVKMNVIEKDDKAMFEVQMKIDKINVEDMFKDSRYKLLLSVFKHVLWKESTTDIYVTFLASAVELGARLPLIPDEGEGIVIHFGSRVNFSEELINLDKEIQPLRTKKDDTCSGFKAMSVERFFKQYNFTLDWCAFKLVTYDLKVDPDEKILINTFNRSNVGSYMWDPPQRELIPSRDYMSEITYALGIPVFIMISLVILLSLVLCFHHEGISKRNRNTPDVLMVQYESIQKVTNTLRSLSNQRNDSAFFKTSSRITNDTNSGLRPNPPPYNSVRQNEQADF